LSSICETDVVCSDLTVVAARGSEVATHLAHEQPAYLLGFFNANPRKASTAAVGHEGPTNSALAPQAFEFFTFGFPKRATVASCTAANKPRHFYDLSRLCGLPEIREFVGTDEYREIVRSVRHPSQENCPDARTPKEDSFSNSPVLSPDPEGLATLKRNYGGESIPSLPSHQQWIKSWE
jgi:hypothetical protein